MSNLFIGFPVARAKIADMIADTAPPSLHHTQHEDGGTDEIDATGLNGAGGAGDSFNSFFIIGNSIEHIQGWNTLTIFSGVADSSYPGLYCETGITANSFARATKGSGWPCPMLTFSKDRLFIANVRLESYTSATVLFHLTSGDYGSLKHIGFKIVNGVLKGTVGNGAAETTVDLETLGAAAYSVNRDLRAVFTAGVDCKFYVDGILLGTITTGLPTGTEPVPIIIACYAGNPGVSENKLIHVNFYHLAVRL